MYIVDEVADAMLSFDTRHWVKIKKNKYLAG